MENGHKEIIRKHYETLVKKMTVDKVVMHLHSIKILSDDMKENLDAEKSRFARSRKRLEIIIRRGPHAFTALRVALVKAGNFLIAKELQNDLNQASSNQEEQLGSLRPLVIDLDQKSERPVLLESKEDGNHQQRCMINIGDNFYVVANTYKGQLRIHIREYETSENGRVFPTKKGVTFPLYRWVFFTSLEPDIADSLKAYMELESEHSWHLGGGVYATINPKYPTVNIRHFWKPANATEPVPTKRGVILSRYRFDKLRDAMKEITEYVPELEDTAPCMCRDDHMNQEGMLRCSECTPFGYYDDLD